jgi:hypothetical protein
MTPHALRNNLNGSMTSSRPGSSSKIIGFVDVEHDISAASIENAFISNSPGESKIPL